MRRTVARVRELVTTSTLSKRYDARANAFGLLRLVLASSVLFAHAWPLGFGEPSFGVLHTRRQVDLGTLAVYGFFVLSGFLVAGSALRLRVRRFAWHRFLRIYPGLWVCLLVTALVIAPAVAWYEAGSLAGFWTHPTGPFDFLLNNGFAGMRQFQISGLLGENPHPTAFTGSLWSLRYEVLCYIILAMLAITAVLRRAPRAVVAAGAVLYLIILHDDLSKPGIMSRPPAHATVFAPLLGRFSAHYVIYLTFLFLLGAAAYLYRHRLPMHWALAGVAALALACSARWGGFFVIGLPAFAYLLLFVGVSAPPQAHGIGRRRDYSYGIYIYGFVVEQVVALVGGNRYGLPAYLLICAVFTVAIAALSWHLVERPAMRLKDWSPRRRRPEPSAEERHHEVEPTATPDLVPADR